MSQKLSEIPEEKREAERAKRKAYKARGTTMNASNAAGLGVMMALAEAVQPFRYAPARHKTITPENTKRRDKTERNKRKQQKESRRRNRG